MGLIVFNRLIGTLSPQFIFPRTLRSGLLHSASGHCCFDFLFCSNHMGPRPHCTIGVGLVYMGFVLVCLTINPRLTSHEASVNFLDGTKIEQQRILLAVYPLLLVSSVSSF